MTSFALEELHDDIGHIKDKDNFECVAKMTTLSRTDPHIASTTRYKMNDIVVEKQKEVKRITSLQHLHSSKDELRKCSCMCLPYRM